MKCESGYHGICTKIKRNELEKINKREAIYVCDSCKKEETERIAKIKSI